MAIRAKPTATMMIGRPCTFPGGLVDRSWDEDASLAMATAAQAHASGQSEARCHQQSSP